MQRAGSVAQMERCFRWSAASDGALLQMERCFRWSAASDGALLQMERCIGCRLVLRRTSASAVDSAMVVCGRECHMIGAPPYRKMTPVIDCRELLSPQSESDWICRVPLGLEPASRRRRYRAATSACLRRTATPCGLCYLMSCSGAGLSRGPGRSSGLGRRCDTSAQSRGRHSRASAAVGNLLARTAAIHRLI
jgi:hypothetical protein